MRRVVLALFTLFALSFVMTTSVAAQDIDCPQISYERAQEILRADPSDPNGLDRDNDGIACENNARGGSGGGDDAAPAESGTGTTGGGATTVPSVGSGTGLYTSDNNIMLVTAFGSVAAVLGLAALRLRQQS